MRQRIVGASAPLRRVCVLSLHTSPLEQPGVGDAGGMNVYIEQTAVRMAQRGVAVEIFTTVPAWFFADSLTVPFVHHAVRDYAVRLVMATRQPAEWKLPELAGQIALGASPRGTLGLLAAGRALAVLRGRRFLVPQDVYDVAPEVLRHRVMLTYDAIAAETTADDIVAKVLATLPAPRVAPSQDALGSSDNSAFADTAQTNDTANDTVNLFDEPAAG